MSTQNPQNYCPEVQAALDNLIILHLQASYTYLSLCFYFEGNRGALENGFFFRLAEEKREGARRLMMLSHLSDDFSQDGHKVSQDEWHNSLNAMEAALNLEKNLNQAILDLHALGVVHKDAQLCFFLESHFLDQEVKIIKKLADYLTNLRRLMRRNASLGEYLFRELTLKGD